MLQKSETHSEQNASNSKQDKITKLYEQLLPPEFLKLLFIMHELLPKEMIKLILYHYLKRSKFILYHYLKKISFTDISIVFTDDLTTIKTPSYSLNEFNVQRYTNPRINLQRLDIDQFFSLDYLKEEALKRCDLVQGDWFHRDVQAFVETEISVLLRQIVMLLKHNSSDNSNLRGPIISHAMMTLFSLSMKQNKRPNIQRAEHMLNFIALDNYKTISNADLFTTDINYFKDFSNDQTRKMMLKYLLLVPECKTVLMEAQQLNSADKEYLKNWEEQYLQLIKIITDTQNSVEQYNNYKLHYNYQSSMNRSRMTFTSFGSNPIKQGYSRRYHQLLSNIFNKKYNSVFNLTILLSKDPDEIKKEADFFKILKTKIENQGCYSTTHRHVSNESQIVIDIENEIQYQATRRVYTF